MTDVAIKVEHVSKDFVLPHQRSTSVKQAFVNPFRSSMHKNTTKQHALKDISLEVKKGEFFGIVGRNGSGKSTLLKMIAGIYQPTKGRVRINGKLVPFIELGVGFNPELTGRENVYLNGALLGFSRKEVSSMYEDIVAFAELKEFMDQKLKNYSSGMQVRLAFSMAIRADADVLLIDEVLAVGDANFQRKCFDYFRQLKRNNKTVIFVSHDMTAVREYCDRAVLINDNKLTAIGSSDEIAKKYQQLFINEQQKDEYKGYSNRWGDGKVVTTKISTVITSSEIVINQQIKSNISSEQPIIGIRIRDATGAEITGTNTLIESITVPKLEIGGLLDLEWRLPNVLRDGRYSIDPAILNSDGVSVADWWDGATYFQVRRARQLPYILDPGFKVTLKRKA